MKRILVDPEDDTREWLMEIAPGGQVLSMKELIVCPECSGLVDNCRLCGGAGLIVKKEK